MLTIRARSERSAGMGGSHAHSGAFRLSTSDTNRARLETVEYPRQMPRVQDPADTCMNIWRSFDGTFISIQVDTFIFSGRASGTYRRYLLCVGGRIVKIGSVRNIFASAGAAEPHIVAYVTEEGDLTLTADDAFWAGSQLTHVTR